LARVRGASRRRRGGERDAAAIRKERELRVIAGDDEAKVVLVEFAA
jgi:hypothetical protein